MTDWGMPISVLKMSPPVWNWPASATMKSLAVKLDTYLSMSKPLVKFTVTVSSTTARDRDVTVTAVLPRLRPRLAQAMDSRDTPLRPFFVLRLMPLPSV